MIVALQYKITRSLPNIDMISDEYRHISYKYFEHGLTLLQSWIFNYIYHKLWDEITYPFLDFDGASNFIPRFTGFVIIYMCWDIRTLHGCSSQMNENLMISKSKLTSDSELIW